MRKLFGHGIAERVLITLGIVAVLAVFIVIHKAWSQPAPQPEAVYSLSVTASEANVIGGALAKLPYETVAPLMVKLQRQVTEQEQATRDVKPKADGIPEPKKP